MNDTGSGWHFGCDRVMRIIEANLAERGIAVCARSRVGNRWWEDTGFLKAASAADIIVINGEGTCHHARPHGEHLLRVVDHPVANEKPVALINALYQENPREWSRYLDKFALISARDSWSAAELSEAVGQPISYLPDLSMSEGFLPQADMSERDLLTIGESVLPETAEELIALAVNHPEVIFLPLTSTLKGPKLKYPFLLRRIRKIYANAHKLIFKVRRRNSQFCRDEFEYSRYLLQSYLHVSGRFHAICLCIATRTPFCAVSSNAWKIESLIEDLGIAKWRIVKTNELEDILENPHGAAFTEEEKENMNAAMARGVSGTTQMFDTIAMLARNRSREEGLVKN